MVGGGQLARMTAPAAIALGVRLRVLAESDDERRPGGGGRSVGDHRDAEAVAGFAAGCDVLTFDHEHVPADSWGTGSGGVAVRPSAQALRPRPGQGRHEGPACRARACPAEVADRARRRGARRLRRRRGLARRAQDAAGRVRRQGRPGGARPEDAADWLARAGGPSGGGVCSPRSTWRSGGSSRCSSRAVPAGRPRPGRSSRPCRWTASAGRSSRPHPASTRRSPPWPRRIGLRIAGELGVVGVLAVEMFQTPAGRRDARVLVNELAMRPHNCGHWTIDGAVTSQFEQHLRAVLDLPLGDPRARAPWSVMVNVLGATSRTCTAASCTSWPATRASRCTCTASRCGPGRKVGHVTVVRRRPGGLPGTRAARGGFPERDDRRVDPDGRRAGRGAIGKGAAAWDSRWSAWSWGRTRTGR